MLWIMFTQGSTVNKGNFNDKSEAQQFRQNGTKLQRVATIKFP